MAFDIPNHPGTYSERYSSLGNFLFPFFFFLTVSKKKNPKIVNMVNKNGSKYVEIAPRVECKGMDHLEEYFHDIIEQGGEGIILRDPSAPYKPGRSPGYLKHKVR